MINRLLFASQWDIYSTKYLTIEALSDNTTIDIVISKCEEVNNIQYPLVTLYTSYNNGAWQKIEQSYQQDIPTVVLMAKGDTLRIKGNIVNVMSVIPTGSGSFLGCTPAVNIYGNILSLMYGDDFKDKYSVPQNSSLAHLFANHGNNCFINDASKLILPVLDVPDNFYAYLFSESEIKIPPVLYGEVLHSNCHEQMFSRCSLESNVYLLAKTLDNYSPIWGSDGGFTIYVPQELYNKYDLNNIYGWDFNTTIQVIR